MEFEFRPDGLLRYANNSNYKNDVMIRKEGRCLAKCFCCCRATWFRTQCGCLCGYASLVPCLTRLCFGSSLFTVPRKPPILTPRRFGCSRLAVFVSDTVLNELQKICEEAEIMKCVHATPRGGQIVSLLYVPQINAVPRAPPLSSPFN